MLQERNWCVPKYDIVKYLMVITLGVIITEKEQTAMVVCSYSVKDRDELRLIYYIILVPEGLVVLCKKAQTCLNFLVYLRRPIRVCFNKLERPYHLA